MMKKSMRSLSLLLLTSCFVTLFNGIDLSQKPQTLITELRLEQPAVAKSKSGGRSGGGSFNRGSSGSRSRSRSNSSSPSRSYQRNDSYDSYDYDRNDSYHRHRSSRSSTVYYGRSNPFVPILLMTILLGIGGLVLFFVIYSMLKRSVNYISPKAKEARILDNDIFTISKLQVALLADAQDVQTSLSYASLNADTDTPEGLREFYNEVILILLRHQQDWTHVNATSQRVSLDNAEAVFGEFSLTERAKFQTETLSNVEGKIRQRNIDFSDDESACYVVVTLIIGTAHDRPLFGQIRQKEELKNVLKDLALIPKDYLMKFEVLWSPQTPEDTMTYDEFVVEYTDMFNLG